MGNINNEILEKARKIVAEHLFPRLDGSIKEPTQKDGLGNVLGVGIGQKIANGRPSGDSCVRVYVQSKFNPPDLIADRAKVLKTVSDFDSAFQAQVQTDVIEIGSFGRRLNPPKGKRNVNAPGSLIRINTLHSNVNTQAAGTFGAVVRDADGKQYILSCNHVLAMNGRIPNNTSVILDDMVTAGKDLTTIGRCQGQFVRLMRGEPNSVDCAMASLEGEVAKADLLLTSPELKDPERGMAVSKFGAGSGPDAATGVIIDVNAEVDIPYSFGTFRFLNQILIDGMVEGKSEQEAAMFATHGDSGAIVVDKGTGQAVGMVFAQAGRYAVACRIDEVLRKLGEVIHSELMLATK